MEVIQNQVDVNKLSFIEKSQIAFNEPRRPGDVDYVSIFYVIIKENFGKESATNFISTPYILAVRDKRPLQQRVMINKFFIYRLLGWRSLSMSFEIWGVLPFLNNEDEFTSWVKALCTHVVPFFKSNFIYV